MNKNQIKNLGRLAALPLVTGGLFLGMSAAKAANLGPLAPGGPNFNQFSFNGNLALQFVDPDGGDPDNGIFKVDFRTPTNIPGPGAIPLQQLLIPDNAPLGPLAPPYFIKQPNGSYAAALPAQDGIYVYGDPSTATGAAAEFNSPDPTQPRLGINQDLVVPAFTDGAIDFPMVVFLTMDPPPRNIGPAPITGADGDIPAANSLNPLNVMGDTFLLTRIFPSSITSDPGNPANSRLQISFEGMYMCGNQALNVFPGNTCYNGTGTYTLPFVGQTPEQVTALLLSGEVITKQYSANYDVRAKAPEPSSVAGLALLGSMLAFYKRKKS